VILAVGVSPVLIRLMAPETYADNLFATAMVTAALVPMLSVARDGRGFLPAILLIGAAGIAHGPFFAVAIGAIGLTALAYAPGSWRAWRRGDTPLTATPSARLVGVAGGAAAVTGAGVLGLLRTGPNTPTLSIGELRKKLHEDLPLYRFPLTLPLAGVGAAWMAWLGFGRRRPGGPSGDRDRFAARFAIVLFGAWTLVCLAGIGWYLLGHDSPAHRFLSFLIPFPILAGVGVLALGRWVFAQGARAAGVAVVALLLAALAFVGYRDLYVDLAGPSRGVEWTTTAKIQDAATAAKFLDAAGAPQSSPVVFVIDDTGPNPLSYVPEMAYLLRTMLPPEREQRAYLYVGDPNRYLAGQPTFRSQPSTYNVNMMRFWPAISRLLPTHPTALLLQAYNPAYAATAAAHPDWVVAPGVIALGGRPVAPAPVAQPAIPTGPRGPVQGALLGVGALVLLALVGLGWAIALLPGGTRSFEVLALAPAFGIALLILAGVLVDAVGIRLVHWGGILAVMLAIAAGAALAVRRVRRDGVNVFRAR
jgi:hypothetical protein